MTWHGRVDLRRSPEEANNLPEVALLPCLAPLLVRLNAPESAFFTVKCDVWLLDEIDPFEFDAEPGTAAQGLACYIDLLPHIPEDWPDHETTATWCDRLCTTLRSAPALRCCRTDMVIRRAVRDILQPAIGITAYLAACGSTETLARTNLGVALTAFVDAIVARGTRTG